MVGFVIRGTRVQSSARSRKWDPGHGRRERLGPGWPIGGGGQNQFSWKGRSLYARRWLWIGLTPEPEKLGWKFRTAERRLGICGYLGSAGTRRDRWGGWNRRGKCRVGTGRWQITGRRRGRLCGAGLDRRRWHRWCRGLIALRVRRYFLRWSKPIAALDLQRRPLDRGNALPGKSALRRRTGTQSGAVPRNHTRVRRCRSR